MENQDMAMLAAAVASIIAVIINQSEWVRLAFWLAWIVATLRFAYLAHQDNKRYQHVNR